MIKSPLKGSGLKLNVYVAPIGEEHKIYLIESSVQQLMNQKRFTK